MSDHHDDEGHEAEERLLKKRIIGLSIALILVSGIVTYLLTMPAWYQNYAPEQPLPFSHRQHAGQYKIPCGYCHSSAEQTQFSAVPGVETCMNCHKVVKTDSPHMKKIKEAYDTEKPIAWVKVHVLPDFVYFNHSRHVAAGVQCQTCHGPVEQMDRVYQYSRLTMGWCVDCHRNNDYITPSRVEWAKKEAELFGTGPRSSIADVLGHPEVHNADLSCSTCHR